MEYILLGELGDAIPCAPGSGPCEGPPPIPGAHCFTLEQLQSIASPGCRNYYDPLPGNDCHYSTVCVTPAQAQAQVAATPGPLPLIAPAAVQAPAPIPGFAPLERVPSFWEQMRTWSEGHLVDGIPNWMLVGGVAGILLLASRRR